MAFLLVLTVLWSDRLRRYSDPKLMKLTPADWRFISFHDYLKQHRDELGYVRPLSLHCVAGYIVSRAAPSSVVCGEDTSQESKIPASQDPGVSALGTKLKSQN